jgi:hypothetical protein
VAAGRYTATVTANLPGAYEVDVAEPNAPRRPGRTETSGFVVPPVAETLSFAANEPALRRIASETGGQLLDSQHPELFAGDRSANANRWDPIWAVFAVLALAAFIADVAVRRLRPSTLRALLGRSSTFRGDASSP